MKKLKIVLPILIIMVMIGCIVANKETTVYAATLKEIDNVTLKINKYLYSLVENNDDRQYLSNPYALVKDSDEYKELIALGIRAINPLYTKLKNSNQSGLIEYIYAMAIEDIMLQNFEYRMEYDITKSAEDIAIQKNSGHIIDYWSNANEFKIAFSHFMEQLPSQYEEIKNNNSISVKEKEVQIKKLGIGVIPYIVEDIESKEGLLNYNNILEDILLEKNIEVSNVNEWISLNSESISMIKEVAK